jgi:hypothetical protein
MITYAYGSFESCRGHCADRHGWFSLVTGPGVRCRGVMLTGLRPSPTSHAVVTVGVRAPVGG